MDTEPNDSHTDAQADAPNQPNEYGFAGEGTGPEPATGSSTGSATESATELDEDELAHVEEVAVPAGDLTGALTESFEELTDRDEDRQDSDR